MATKIEVKRAVHAIVPVATFAVDDSGGITRWESPFPKPTQREIDNKIAEQRTRNAASAAQQVEDDVDKADVTGDDDIRALVRLRPSEIDIWVDANVHSLDDVKSVMIRLLKITSIVARQALKI